MQNIEIEIKLKLEKPEILLQWLKKKAKLIKTLDQTDYYFDPPHKSFIFTDKEGYKDAEEWFRVRLTEKGDEVCYKLWHRDPKTNKSLYADEIETSIGDRDKFFKILSNLGFKQTCLIKKHRESYKYQDFQFDCDDVESLGFFVEIEYKGEIDDPKKGKEKIFKFLESIGINDWKKSKRGYAWIFWNPDKEHFEDRPALK